MFRQVCRDAKRDGVLKYDPTQDFRTPQVEQTAREILDPAQLPVLLDAAQLDQKVGTLVILLGTTGVRLGEALGLTWGDLDLQAGKMNIERTSVDLSGQLSVQPPKTEAGKRSITLPREAIEALGRHRERLGALPLPGRSVFAGRSGKLISRRSIYAAWRELLRSCGLPDTVVPHSLRHLFATNALRSGVPVHIVAGYLGHANPSVTWNTYSRFLKADSAAVASKMDEILAGLRKRG